MAFRKSRAQQDVEILTNRRGPDGRRAVRWDEINLLAEKIGRILIGSKAGKDLTKEAIRSGYVDDTINRSKAAQEARNLIETANTFITNEAKRLDDQISDTAAIDSDLQQVTVRVDDAEAAITAEQIARSDGDTAIAEDLTVVETRVGDAEAAITAEQIARSDADTALSQDLSTVSADLAAAEAEVTTNASAIATIENYQAATYTVRVKAGGASAGFEMVAADDPINGPASAIRFTADDILFDGTVYAQHIDMVSLTADTGFINNLTVDKANIADAAVGSATIADAAVDTLKIAGNAVSFSQYYSSGVDYLGDGTFDTVFDEVVISPPNTITRVFYAIDFEQGYNQQRDWSYIIEKYDTENVTPSSDTVVNGQFSGSAPEWTKGTGWTAGNGLASCDGTQTADSDLEQEQTTTVGEVYVAKFIVQSYQAGRVSLVVDNTEVVSKKNTDGSFSVFFTATSTSHTLKIRAAPAPAMGDAILLFEDWESRYIGDYASAPTVDGDGNALVKGALYWNSTSDQMLKWDGSAWNVTPITEPFLGEIDDVTFELAAYTVLKERYNMSEIADYSTVTGLLELDNSWSIFPRQVGIRVKWRGQDTNASGDQITLTGGTTLTLEVAYK